MTAPRGEEQPRDDAGLTLVEVVVSLVLFGLITLAGFSFVDTELRTRARTQGRLERLGDLQRAMYLLTSDIEQMSGGEPAMAGETLSFRRFSGAGGETEVRYALADGALERILGAAADDRAQKLVSGVQSIHWSFYVQGAGWGDAYPATGQGPQVRPTAVALDMTLKGEGAGEGGVLRRLVALPGRP